jgi:VanZ family protein
VARRDPKRTSWTLVGIWMVVVAVGSLAPGATSLPASDFASHAFAYGVLAWLMGRAMGTRPALLNAVLAASLSWLFGFAIEGLQELHPDRRYEVRDIIANAYGVAGGAILALVFPGYARAGEP